MLTLKLISKHSIDSLLQAIQTIIIKHNKDYHNKVTYQTILGTFSFSLVYGKKLRFSSNVYLSSLFLAQFSPRQSFVMQSQIKELLKMENISTDHVYASNNLFSQIKNLVSNQDKVRKTKMKHAQKLWLDPYKEIWKSSLSISYS